MSLAFWPFLKRKRGRRKEEEEHEKKGEEDRSTEKRTPICSKCANVSSVLFVFVICKSLGPYSLASVLVYFFNYLFSEQNQTLTSFTFSSENIRFSNMKCQTKILLGESRGSCSIFISKVVSEFDLGQFVEKK